MKHLLVLLVIATFIASSYAQRIRVPEPKEIGITIKPDFLKGEKVNVLIYDGRILPDNVIDDYETDKITQNVFNYLRNTFTSITFTRLDKSQLYDKPTTKELFLKIRIINFQVSFGGTKVVSVISGNGAAVGMSGEWNALVSYSVVILDNRTDQKTYKTEIQEISSGPTMTTIGITAKNLMTKSYAKASQSLVNFIEDSLSSW